MARDRLLAVGTTGQANFAVTQAQVLQGQESLTCLLACRLEILSQLGSRLGFVEAQSRRAVNGPDATRPRAPEALLRQTMDDLNVEFEFQLRRNLRDWIAAVAPGPDGGMPAPGPADVGRGGPAPPMTVTLSNPAGVRNAAAQRELSGQVGLAAGLGVPERNPAAVRRAEAPHSNRNCPMQRNRLASASLLTALLGLAACSVERVVEAPPPPPGRSIPRPRPMPRSPAPTSRPIPIARRRSARRRMPRPRPR